MSILQGKQGYFRLLWWSGPIAFFKKKTLIGQLLPIKHSHWLKKSNHPILLDLNTGKEKSKRILQKITFSLTLKYHKSVIMWLFPFFILSCGSEQKIVMKIVHPELLNESQLGINIIRFSPWKIRGFCLVWLKDNKLQDTQT